MVRTPPLIVTHSLTINKAQQTWRVHIHGHLLNPSQIPTFADIPAKLNASSVSVLLSRLSELNICVGNPDPEFTNLGKNKKNGHFLSADKAVVAYLDRSACVSLHGHQYPVTVRCYNCHLLTDGLRCPVCSWFRNNLHAQLSRAMRSRTMEKSKKTNYR